jgi:predicted Zn-dependent protease
VTDFETSKRDLLLHLTQRLEILPLSILFVFWQARMLFTFQKRTRRRYYWRPSEVDDYRQARLRNRFAELIADLSMTPYYRLEFRHSKKLGPNAFALPGGIIVITDEMVWEAGSEDEVSAVLAQEIGHIELRHAMRLVMEGSALAAVAGVVTSDASSFSVAVAGLPILLAQTRYSRQAETEADEFGFKLLKRHGISPDAFASLMERLAIDYPDKERAYSFLSTHPNTAERAARASSRDQATRLDFQDETIPRLRDP